MLAILPEIAQVLLDYFSYCQNYLSFCQHPGNLKITGYPPTRICASLGMAFSGHGWSHPENSALKKYFENVLQNCCCTLPLTVVTWMQSLLVRMYCLSPIRWNQMIRIHIFFSFLWVWNDSDVENVNGLKVICLFRFVRILFWNENVDLKLIWWTILFSFEYKTTSLTAICLFRFVRILLFWNENVDLKLIWWIVFFSFEYKTTG